MSYICHVYCSFGTSSGLMQRSWRLPKIRQDGTSRRIQFVRPVSTQTRRQENALQDGEIYLSRADACCQNQMGMFVKQPCAFGSGCFSVGKRSEHPWGAMGPVLSKRFPSSVTLPSRADRVIGELDLRDRKRYLAYSL